MRKLLNTIYVTNEQAYLTLDGENLVCKIDGTEKLRWFALTMWGVLRL